MAQTLTDSERAVLTGAARRPDGRIHPLPEGVDADPVIGTLVQKGLVEQGLEERPGQTVRVPFYRISDKGLKVLQPDPNRDRQASNGTQGPTAVDAFLATKAEIDAALERIRDANEEHFDLNPDDVNWGHVGDLRDYADRLKEITDKIFREGEYAE